MTLSPNPAFQPTRFVAKTFHGLESVLAEELRQLGAGVVVPLRRAVEFSGSAEILYKANLRLRTALRILRPIATFRATDEHHLYRQVQKVDWGKWLTASSTLAVDSTVHSRFFNHSKYVALKTKDAIVDQLRSQTGKRPSVDVQNPDLRIQVHLSNDACILSIDSSGESLHRRGYRVEATEAPLNEILAAGLVLLSGWNGEGLFIEPMCGSGTIAIEAGLIGCRIAPGILRQEFAFMKWPDFDASLWKSIRREAEQEQRRPLEPIQASDRDASAIDVARRNVHRAGLESAIALRSVAFEDLKAPAEPATIVMNPPYGERLQESDIHALYEKIGDTLKQKYAGCRAWIISANPSALKHVGLRPSTKTTLFNGPLECTLAGYELYAGSRRKTSTGTVGRKG